MKKNTVETFLAKLEHQAKRVQQEGARRDQINAVTQCRTWLELPWADMLPAVNTRLEELTTQAQPLLEKEKQKQSITEQEQQQLQGMRDVYAIYTAFQQKISPTARRASVERHVREQERNRGK